MKCFICENRRDFTALFPKLCSTNNYLCNKCGLVFIPRGDTVNPSYYKEDGYFKKSPNKGLRKGIVSRGLLESRGKKRFQLIEPLLGIDLKNKSILDVGCGHGHILYAIKKKYSSTSVMGIEPSKEAAEMGNQMFDVPIKSVLLNEFNGKKKSFDVILSSHTLEHVEDPIQFLKSIRDLLTDEGYFYLEIPNVMVPTGNFKLNDFFYNEHLQTFSSYNLYKLLTKLGFVVVDYSDADFLCFVCRKNKKEGNSVEISYLSSENILEFLYQYKRSYSLLDTFKVYFNKMLYLQRALYYKLLSFLMQI